MCGVTQVATLALLTACAQRSPCYKGRATTSTTITGIKPPTCVVAVMDTTNDGTEEQLRFTRRPWNVIHSDIIIGSVHHVYATTYHTTYFTPWNMTENIATGTIHHLHITQHITSLISQAETWCTDITICTTNDTDIMHHMKLTSHIEIYDTQTSP